MQTLHSPAFHAIALFTLTAALSLPAAAQSAATASAVPRPVFLRPSSADALECAVASYQVDTLDRSIVIDSAWPEAVKRIFVRSPGFQENLSSDEAPRPAAGQQSIALALEHPGVTLVGIDLTPRDLDWPVESFRALPGAAANSLALPDSGTVRATLIECANSIVRVGSGPGSTETVGTSKAGQVVEIRPLMDPASTPVGSDILLKVYIRGDAVKDAIVTATNASTGEVQEVNFAPAGAGFFHVASPGLWRLEFRKAIRTEKEIQPTWTVYSATLTFATPSPAAAAARAQRHAEEEVESRVAPTTVFEREVR